MPAASHAHMFPKIQTCAECCHRSPSHTMSLLDQLWDDTVAGPRPDDGLGRLRKYPSFSSNPIANSPKGVVEGTKGDRSEEVKTVTRSIMIVKPPGYMSPPVSPASSSTPPVSPFSGGKNSSWLRRRSLPNAQERANDIATRLKDDQPPSDV